MAKRDQVKKAAAAKAVKRTSAKEYFRGIKMEMSKVVWPTKKELGSFTVVVIATCAVFALGFWLIDTGVLAGLKSVLGITLN
ncbi:MAG: preprotein translocase subunit SecE [Emergencia sp.]|nr:preprotein translocase subunit SecE [Emergencia sp.]